MLLFNYFQCYLFGFQNKLSHLVVYFTISALSWKTLFPKPSSSIKTELLEHKPVFLSFHLTG